MPELPEVESVVRAIRSRLIGARITAARLHHDDMLVEGEHARPIRTASAGASTALLLDGTLVAVHRHGKQAALEVDDGRILVVHLGMSGRLRLFDALAPRKAERSAKTAFAGTERAPHTHAVWRFESAQAATVLHFVDPRRFGRLWSFDSKVSLLASAWRHLGPDALTIDARALHTALVRSNRPIKVLLLDQAVIAGIGNIYADEILHRARVHPLTPASELGPRAAGLAAVARRVLARAVTLGGSTIRDYIDPAGNLGSFQREHRVYGRAGLPCVNRAATGTCRGVVEVIRLAGRTTAFCARCQPRIARYPQSTSRRATRAS